MQYTTAHQTLDFFLWAPVHCFMRRLHINKEGTYQCALCARTLWLEDMSARGTKCIWVICPLSPMHVKG